MHATTAVATDQTAPPTIVSSLNNNDFSMHCIEAAIAQSSESRRHDYLRRVTELFAAGAAAYSEGHIAVFDRVFQQLIENIEAAVLAELGERLALIARAPLGVMLVLANHDEIAVAGPVLTRFERFATADLCDIAEAKSQAHLMAISSRARLEEALTDVLVRRGNNDVVRMLAANAGAKFSEDGMNGLADRAADDKALAESVARRTDLPHHIFCKLLVATSSAVRERLLTIADPELRAEACRILEKVSGQIADQAPAPRSYGTAIRQVLLDTARRELTEEVLLGYALNNQVDEAIAALSLISSLSTEKIERVLTRAEHESLFIICKAAGLTWDGARAMVLLKRTPSEVSPEALAELRQRFDNIPSSQAQRRVKAWSLNG